jgi:membrane-associated phospholipid phosphatase
MNANIHLSRKDKIIYAGTLLTIGIVLCLFFCYLDKRIILLARTFHYNHSFIGIFLEMIDPIIDFFSHGATLLVFSIILYLGGRFWNSTLYEPGKFLIMGFLSSGLAAQILKYSVGRVRPRLTNETIFCGLSMKDAYHSFPSGHTTVAFCFAYILSCFLPRYCMIFYFFACLVGFERIEDMKHFPSDVLAGALLGIIIGRLLIAARKFRTSEKLL